MVFIWMDFRTSLYTEKMTYILYGAIVSIIYSEKSFTYIIDEELNVRFVQTEKSNELKDFSFYKRFWIVFRTVLNTMMLSTASVFVKKN
eukprot:snap_masked-scaffold_10-processed-gene-13.36-mRNA-1 protein AED:1.00 eAED:1.00 QI:0/-1/0/0/-1/1/1/0/88